MQREDRAGVNADAQRAAALHRGDRIALHPGQDGQLDGLLHLVRQLLQKGHGGVPKPADPLVQRHIGGGKLGADGIHAGLRQIEQELVVHHGLQQAVESCLGDAFGAEQLACPPLRRRRRGRGSEWMPSG